jgi:soluble lytic murein transglycosylase
MIHQKARLLSLLAILAVMGPIPLAHAGEKPAHHKPDKKHAPKRTPRRESKALDKAEAAIARQTFEALSRGNWPAAHGFAAKAHDPILNKLVTYYELADTAGSSSFDAISQFARANPDWPRHNGLIAKAEALIPDRLTPLDIITWFDGMEPSTAAGEIKLGRALIDTGRRDLGVGLIRRAWVNRTLTREQESEITGDFRDLLTDDDQNNRLDHLLWDEQIEAANRQILRVDAGHQALAKARLALMAEAGNVDTLIARVPDSLRNDQGLIYERARWRRRADQQAEALDLVLSAPQGRALSHPAKWWTERHILARWALAQGDIANAYLLAAGHGNDNGIAFAQGEFLAGWLALRHLNQPATALEHFARLDSATVTPASKSRAAYWAARACEALSRPEESRSWYEKAAKFPTSFYGQLADEALGHRLLVLPPAPDPSEEQRVEFENIELVRALRYVEAAGEDDKARPFIAKLAEIAPSPESFFLLAEIARIEGRPEIALQIAKEAVNRGVILPEHGYPLIDFSPVASRDSAAIERPLVFAISRQESAFNHRAVSHAGAMGLMQLLPSTAKQVARNLHMRFEKTKLTEDPKYNATLGSAFLGDLVASQRGSYVLSIAAYNAGPGRIRQWLREFGDPRNADTDPIDWIERIPFVETRDYVQRVLENLQVYRMRLAGKPVPASLVEDLNRAKRAKGDAVEP